MTAHRTAPAERTSDERAVSTALRRHVLAVASAPRNLWHYDSLQRTAAYIDEEFSRAGYVPRRQVFEVEGRRVANIEVERRGSRRPERVLVIGAHYDSVADSPGANDNASGVAVILELARLNATLAPPVTVRFVAFVNEEPPYFMTAAMGIWRYAADAAARRDNIVAMISLETIGYYSDEVGSQRYPFPFGMVFPNRGNFVAMVSNVRSVGALRRAAKAFRSATCLPLIASPAPRQFPASHGLITGRSGSMVTGRLCLRTRHFTGIRTTTRTATRPTGWTTSEWPVSSPAATPDSGATLTISWSTRLLLDWSPSP